MKKLRLISEKIKDSLNSRSVNAWWEGFCLSPGWIRGPVIGLGLLLVILAGFYGVDSHTGYGLLVDLALPILLVTIGYLFILATGGWLIRILLKLPPLIWVVIIAALFFGLEVWGRRTWAALGF